MTTCAERVIEGSSAFWEREILQRVANDEQVTRGLSPSARVRIRVYVLTRKGDAIVRDVVFISSPHRLEERRRGIST